MLQRLAAWRREHGTSHVPRRAHDAADLGEWLWKQRRARRRGQISGWLAAELDALSVDWHPPAEASRWHAGYHAARRARDVGWASLIKGLGRQEAEEEEEEEEQQPSSSLPAGWRAARALASAGDPAAVATTTTGDPLHDAAASWLRRQGELTLAASPGLAPRDGAAATARERQGMLRRFGGGSSGESDRGGLLEARVPRAAVADAAAMAGLNAHERKLERRRRRDAEREREARREAERREASSQVELAEGRARAEHRRREALRAQAEAERRGGG
jgi:hypothetical protein